MVVLRVQHIVLLKTVRPLTTDESTALRTKLMQIPGVLEVSSGANYTQRSQGFNIGIIVTLNSKEAEAAYQTHPIHVEVRDTIIKPLLTGLSLHALGPDKRLLASSHLRAVCRREATACAGLPARAASLPNRLAQLPRDRTRCRLCARRVRAPVVPRRVGILGHHTPHTTANWERLERSPRECRQRVESRARATGKTTCETRDIGLCLSQMDELAISARASRSAHTRAQPTARTYTTYIQRVPCTRSTRRRLRHRPPPTHGV